MAVSQFPSTFDDIKTYLIDKIGQKYPSLVNFLENSFLMIFVDVIAYAIELFMSFATFLFNEWHLPSTQQFENARIGSKFFGYKAHFKRSATGTIKVGLDSDFSTAPLENIILRQYDRLTINGIDYLVAEDTAFTTSDTEISVPTIQGRYITVNNSALGEQNEFFDIEDDSVEDTTFDAEVDGTPYSEVDSFFKSGATSEDFVKDSLKDLSGVRIVFGDGFNGAILTNGAAVALKYIQTDALDGQIKSVGFPVTFLETYQYSDTSTVTFYGENDSKLEGADDIEAISSVKYYGQIAASSMDDKAFNDSEVKLQLQNFGGILMSKTISEFDVNEESPDFTRANRVQLLVILTSGDPVSDLKKQQIRQYLRDKMDFTDFIEFIDVDIINIKFTVDAEVNISAPQDFAAQLDTYLATQYAISALDFGESINHSEVVKKIGNEFSDYLVRFNLVMSVTETDTSVTIATGNIVNKTLLVNSIRDVGSASIVDCTIEAEFVSTVTGSGTTETLVSKTDGTFEEEEGGVSEILSSGTIDFETGAIVLNLLGTISSISSLKYIYNTYDVDGIPLNVDVLYNQVIQYGESSIAVEIIS